MLGRHPVTDAAVGAGIGLVVASLEKGKPLGSRAAVGSALGVVLGAMLRRSRGGPLRAGHFVGFAVNGETETLVGWSQPPRPADVVVNFNPHASKRDQARAVLYDYYHDDPLRYWSDNEAVKRCFIGGSDPRKENHDVLLLIAAYENKNHPVWKCQYSDTKNHNIGDGMHWNDLDKAVQQAIAHRRKLGSLPKSSYDTNPVVIYYYDNDKMKRITYPMRAVPNALDPVNISWWATPQQDNSDAAVAAGLDDIHTRETDDPKKIALERAKPGWTKGMKDNTGSAGDWSSEGFVYDKDWVGKGIWGSITGAVMAVITAIGTAATAGILAAPLGALSAVVTAAVQAADTAIHAGDFGAALAQLGPALIQAAVSAAGSASGSAGFKIPPAALKALGSTLSVIAKDVADAQQKKGADFGAMWAEVAKKAQSYSKVGDDEAEAIAHLISGQSATAGHIFIQGFLAGKFLDAKAMSGIGNILSHYAAFADPRIINIALLGIGIGYISKTQQQGPRAKTQQQGPRSKHVTGAFFYDEDLARRGLGNAVSPFVQMPGDKAVQAMYLRPEDRYGPRLEHPNWVDWSRWW